MKFKDYIIESKIEKAKEILKLLNRDTKVDDRTKGDRKRTSMSRLEYKGQLKNLNLSKKEIDELVKWQEKMGYSK